MIETELPIQTRSSDGALRFFATIKEALQEADKDSSIWKISFSIGEERVVLDRQAGWILRENFILREWL